MEGLQQIKKFHTFHYYLFDLLAKTSKIFHYGDIRLLFLVLLCRHFLVCSPPYGTALSVAPCLSVRLSVRPSRATDFLETGKLKAVETSNLVEAYNAGQE